jgi:hypothetical protein
MSAEVLNKARDRWLNSFKKDARGLRKKRKKAPLWKKFPLNFLCL